MMQGNDKFGSQTNTPGSLEKRKEALIQVVIKNRANHDRLPRVIEETIKAIGATTKRATLFEATGVLKLAEDQVERARGFYASAAVLSVTVLTRLRAQKGVEKPDGHPKKATPEILKQDALEVKPIVKANLDCLPGAILDEYIEV